MRTGVSATTCGPVHCCILCNYFIVPTAARNARGTDSRNNRRSAPGDAGRLQGSVRQQVQQLSVLADAASLQVQQLQLQNTALKQRSHVLECFAGIRNWQLKVLSGTRDGAAMPDCPAKLCRREMTAAAQQSPTGE